MVGAAPMAAPPLAAVRPGGHLRVSCSASTAPSSKSNGGPPKQQLARRRQQQQLPAPPLSSAAVPLLLAAAVPPDALAAGGEFGILEGRSFALLHPLVMGGLFGYTLWAGYLGWQWRRVRTVQDEINDLKKQLKPAAAAARAQVAGRDQDRRAHRGAEEAAQGVVPGSALQRGVHPARPRRARVRRRPAQHLVPHRQALPGAPPLRRSGHHGAVGGRGGAGPGDAEGERDGQEPAHRAQRAQRPALHLADPHRPRDRRQGLRVHHLAMTP